MKEFSFRKDFITMSEEAGQRAGYINFPNHFSILINDDYSRRIDNSENLYRVSLLKYGYLVNDLNYFKKDIFGIAYEQVWEYIEIVKNLPMNHFVLDDPVKLINR